MCKFKVSWFGKQAQHRGASAACSLVPLSSPAPGVLFCRLASSGTSAILTLAQLSQMCKPAPLDALHLQEQIRGAATHLQCSGQQSPGYLNCILPSQRGTILLLLFSPASSRPRICPRCGGAQLAYRKQIKRRPTGMRMQWQELAAKTGRATSPKDFFWQRTHLASVCSGVSKQRGPQMLPRQSRGAHSCPSSTGDPALPGDAQLPCKSQP